MQELFWALLYHIRQESFWWGFIFAVIFLALSTVLGGCVGKRWAEILQFRAPVPAVKLPGERPSGCQRLLTCFWGLGVLALVLPLVVAPLVWVLLSLLGYALVGEWPTWGFPIPEGWRR